VSRLRRPAYPSRRASGCARCREGHSGNDRTVISGDIQIGGTGRSAGTVTEADGTGDPGILVLCTANVCRSPLAAAMLARGLAAVGARVGVRSAGMLSDGDPVLPEVAAVMAERGLGNGGHRSRLVGAADLAGAGLVLGMARLNVRHAVVTLPAAWPRTFTLKELVRRGEQIGPREPGEPLAGWLSRAHAGRERSWLLGDSGDDDVADPAGGPQPGYESTATLLDQLVTRLVTLCWGHAGPAS
jgi:protein-tyrosine phosphatase